MDIGNDLRLYTISRLEHDPELMLEFKSILNPKEYRSNRNRK